MRIYTIYDHPKDYPNHFVMRVFDVSASASTPTGDFTIADTLEEVRKAIPSECVCIARDLTDDPVVVESWI